MTSASTCPASLLAVGRVARQAQTSPAKPGCCRAYYCTATPAVVWQGLTIRARLWQGRTAGIAWPSRVCSCGRVSAPICDIASFWLLSMERTKSPSCLFTNAPLSRPARLVSMRRNETYLTELSKPGLVLKKVVVAGTPAPIWWCQDVPGQSDIFWG